MNKLPFFLYMFFTGILSLGIVITPYLASQNNPLSGFLYDDVFSKLCHQKISRSHCLFESGNGYYISDCLPQNGIYREDSRSEKTAMHEGNIGYKFSVSARDMLIYLAMFVGGIVVFLMGKAYSTEIPPAIWFVLALIPIGIDGTTQTILMIRESTNLLRVITGFIAGFAVPFYAIPILNKMFNKNIKR